MMRLIFRIRMRASSYHSSVIPSDLRPPLLPLSGKLHTRRVRLRQRKKVDAKVRAIRRDDGMDDHTMATFREGIKEVEAINRGDDKCVLELEKEYRYTFFESHSCEILGRLQLDPTSPRPRLAVGVTLMVSLSMPIPVLVIMLHFMDFAKGVADRIHLNEGDFKR